MNEQNQKPMNKWLEAELKELEQEQPKHDLKPALKLEENKVTEFEIIQGREWQRYVDSITGTVKKIIPIMHGNPPEEKVFFLSTKNPTYRELVMKASKGELKIKIVRVGQAKGTRYNLVQ